MTDSDDLKVLATAGLILTDTLIFHEVLARNNPKIKTLSQIRVSGNIKRELEDEWAKILEINYAPVFELGLDILRSLPASPALDKHLRLLIDTAYDIAASNVLLRHDLMGRIYHQLLLGKLVKYYATLYTSIPAARLLARLVVNLPSEIEYGNVPPRFRDENLRVVDFACGSGTLLSAVYKELDARHRIDSDSPDSDALHKYLVEEGIWGFDVLLHAAHLTALTLFLHNPFSPVSKSNIYVLPLGMLGKPEKPHFGSLDFLQSSEISSIGRLIGGYVGPQRVSVSERRSEEASEIPKFHICIMNPPFTRSVGGNLLFGSLPKKERKELQKEYGKLLKSKNLSGIGQAGLGAAFVFLADSYLKEGGRLALVLPKAVLAGIAWREIRRILLEKYHIEYVISSFEGPNDWNFSENTSLSEVLLVARKVKGKVGGKHTIFVNLWSKPQNEIESIFVGSLLIDLYDGTKFYDITNANATPFHIKLRGRKIGEAYSAIIEEVDFGFYQIFAQAELNRVIILLRQGTVYTPTQGIVGRIPLTPLKNFIEDIGPDRRQVHNAFTKGGRYSSRSTYCALWGHSSTLIRAIEQEPNVSLEPKNKQNARALWEKSGNLLIAERTWLSTNRLLAITTTRKVLSNVWWPVKIKDLKLKGTPKIASAELNKLLVLWLNSTHGLLLLLSIAEVTRGAWIGFKKGPLFDLPVLDFRKLTKQQINRLLDLYNKICKEEFAPLPEEFEKPNVRKRIDDEFNQILGLETSLDDLYKMLAKDPTITAKPLK